MRQDRRISTNENIEKQLFQPHRGHVMRRFDQDITGVREGEEVAGLQSCDKIRHDMIVGPGGQLQRDAFPIKSGLERRAGLPDRCPGIMIETGQNMRRAGEDRYAIGHRRARHGERDGEIGGAVIETGKDVAMQVNHGGGQL